MADIYTREKRSEVMRRVRGRNTGLEVRVRSALHRMGYRFRLHTAALPGHPDIVLSRHRKVIFVHGCFWHQHPGCRRSKLPATNVDWWGKKLARNAERDRENLRSLKALGWVGYVLWECRIKTPESLTQELRRVIRR